ncbi:hypothetical protein HYT02_03635 [Candidatus Gottesmanbacteria bacterium]|nr:hypothetical protein [Candidatus Gottesmanbacteria bacterium]
METALYLPPDVLEVRNPDVNNLFLLPKESIPYDAHLIERIANAGFDIDAEYRRKDILNREFGEKGNRIFVAATTDEILEYAFEYSRKDPVRRPRPYLLKEGRLFSPSYQEYLDVFTKPFEREGATYEGALKVQALLKDAPDDAYVIWSSPPGWIADGYQPYMYGWTHFFRKDGVNQDGDSNVVYVSARTKLNARQLGEWSNSYLSPNDKLDLQSADFDTREGIKRVVSTPVLVNPEQFNIQKLSDFTRPINDGIKKYNEVIYSDKEGISYTLADLGESLDKAEQTSKTERDILQPLIEYFEAQLLNAQTEEDAKMIMANYFIKANQILRDYRDLNSIPFSISDNNNFLAVNPSRVSTLLSTLQEVGGCGSVQNAATFSSVKEKKQKFTCPECGKDSYGPVGNKCPQCGITFEEYVKKAKKTGKKVCA